MKVNEKTMKRKKKPQKSKSTLRRYISNFDVLKKSQKNKNGAYTVHTDDDMTMTIKIQLYTTGTTYKKEKKTKVTKHSYNI